MLHTAVCLCVALLFVSHAHSQANDPIVETNYGAVRGTSVPLENGDVIDTFLAIPFARPQTGALRFEPPEEPEAWDDVYNATDLGDACWQGLLNTIQFTHPVWTRYSENCLHLNVYSKQTSDATPRPVFVYIYGGSFQSGVNFSYPGYFLATKDVIVVSINYRLGIMGFASTGDDVVPGNMGLLDQVQALRWVRDNIGAFGGDPDHVTIFGESAGGASVGMLELYPEAEGLFHGAMFQSGTEMSPWAVNYPNTEPVGYLQQVAEQFDCPTLDSQAMIDCLRTVDAEALEDSRFECTNGSTACLGFQPLVDGTVIPDLPHLLRERGQFIRVPEVIGFNRNDAFGFIPIEFDDGVTHEELEQYWEDTAHYLSWLWPDPTRSDDWAAAMEWHYTDWPYFNDTARNRHMVGEYLTDYYYGFPSDYHAKTSVPDMPVYIYVYDYLSENDIPDWEGTTHGYELSYVFGWPFLWENPAALEHSQVSVQEYNYTARDREYSDFIMTLWTNFAKYGNPTPEPVGPGEESPIDWLDYVPGRFSYAYLATTPYVDIDYRQKEYAYFTEYLNYIIYGQEFRK